MVTFFKVYEIFSLIRAQISVVGPEVYSFTHSGFAL